MTDNSPLIELEAVSKVFSTEEIDTHALDGIHLALHEGEFVAIAGPSGSGKTTLLSVLGLLDAPTSGLQRMKGHPVNGLDVEQRARLRNEQIGFVFQSFNLIGDLDVYDNVELPLLYRGFAPADRKRRVESALERVGMSSRMKHTPSQLSGGQQQRVAVARAVAGEPALILADEPTGNLDSRNGAAVMDLLRDLHRAGTTICMVTHNPEYADYAGRTVHLTDGRIVDEDDADVPRARAEEGPRPAAV